MKKAETVTDDKGNVYVVPGQMTREEAETLFPSINEWKTVAEDPEAWKKRPHRIEMLFPDGRIGKFIVIEKGPGEAQLIADDVCFEGTPATHWRPIKK
jgi:hypothetical protein